MSKSMNLVSPSTEGSMFAYATYKITDTSYKTVEDVKAQLQDTLNYQTKRNFLNTSTSIIARVIEKLCTPTLCHVIYSPGSQIIPPNSQSEGDMLDLVAREMRLMLEEGTANKSQVHKSVPRSSQIWTVSEPTRRKDFVEVCDQLLDNIGQQHPRDGWYYAYGWYGD